MYLFEYGVSVATSSENVGAMASLGRKSRVSGLNWVVSVLFLLFVTPLASYSWVFMWESHNHPATFTSPGYKAQEALDLYVGRECTYYADYVPHLNPWLCGPKGKRMDISCYDEDQCHLWTGNGRCLAVPWAPASEYLFTSKEEYDPILDQDYPQYCAARYLHDVTTNNAKAVINHKGLSSDWMGTFRKRLPLAFLLVIGAAGVIAAISAFGFNGDAVGSMCRTSSQVIRSTIGVFAFAATILLTAYTITWWRSGRDEVRQHLADRGSIKRTFGKYHLFIYALGSDWNKGLTNFGWQEFFHPDIWAYAIIQAFLTLRVGTGQNELVGSQVVDKKHMMFGSIGYLCMQTLMCFCVFISCWFAYGYTALKIDMSNEPERGYSVIRFDLRNNPYGTLFTSLQTMFDNSALLNGNVSPVQYRVAIVFWLAMGLLGINGVSHCIDTIAGAFALSSWNWRGGRLAPENRGNPNSRWAHSMVGKALRTARHKVSDALSYVIGGSPRWCWVVLITVIAWCLTIPEWFGMGWGITVTFHHFTTHFLYPAIILYQAISMGWMVGYDLRVKHFGKTFSYVQIGTFLAGCLIGSMCSCALWRTAPLYSPWIGVAVGVLVMLASFGVPLFFLRTHDAYGRRHDKRDGIEMIGLGSVDHIRREINLRCCHTSQLFRMTIFSSLSLRYAVPIAAVMAFANVLTSPMRLLWHFSPYVPFDFQLFNDQFLMMQNLMERYDLVRAPVWLIVIASVITLLLICAMPLFYVYPEKLDWLVPYHTDENFFQVREAIEKFAHTTKTLTQAPFEDEQTQPIAQYGYSLDSASDNE